MKRSLIIFLLFLSLAFAVQTKTYGNVTVNRVISVYDGDTLRVAIDNYPAIIGDNMPVRIFGIDTPELNSKDNQERAAAYRARNYLRSLLKGAKVIELRNIRREKYFRLLADVYADGQSVGELLLKKGYAVRYDGGTKQKFVK
jgi:endonuclease YncB( thermonuclease family)